MSELDQQIRLAAFEFLDRAQAENDILHRAQLIRGFDFHGQRVPLIGPQGIFKPRLCELPLSITTVPIPDDGVRPYDDTIGNDGLLRYRYRGTNIAHHENVGLRDAGRQGTPLIYFHGVSPNRYVADYPVFIVGDDPGTLTFTVSVDDRRFASLGSAADDSVETGIRRRYVTRLVQQRLHQREFRERVLDAYRRTCSICRLKRDSLLDAAHIIADREQLGVPTVPNGISLCRLHHAAFDSHLMTITPDYSIHVRDDVLVETDGPMLIHGLQGFHGARMGLPRLERHWPNRELLEERYRRFKQAV